MKPARTGITKNSAQSGGAKIPSALLCQRLSEETLEMVRLTSELQMTLGPAIASEGVPDASKIKNAQAIDRLHQTLKEIHSALIVLSQTRFPLEIDLEELKSSLNLMHFSDKVSGATEAHSTPSDDNDGDVTWF